MGSVRAEAELENEGVTANIQSQNYTAQMATS
jgi:hypothetical protein